DGRRDRQPPAARRDDRRQPDRAGASRPDRRRAHGRRRGAAGEGRRAAVDVRGERPRRRRHRSRGPGRTGGRRPPTLRTAGLQRFMSTCVEVAPGVYVLRYPVLDVNATLVAGAGAALLVDTLSTDAQARELRDAVGRVTTAPLTVVNTHHHFDHCFGNGVVVDADRPVWAHEEAARLLREQVGRLQREWYLEWSPTHLELAEALAAVTVRPPDHIVHSEATLDIGGRPVVLRHL